MPAHDCVFIGQLLMPSLVFTRAKGSVAASVLRGYCRVCLPHAHFVTLRCTQEKKLRNDKYDEALEVSASMDQSPMSGKSTRKPSTGKGSSKGEEKRDSVTGTPPRPQTGGSGAKVRLQSRGRGGIGGSFTRCMTLNLTSKR